MSNGDDDRGESRRTIARREQRKAGDRSAKLAHELMKVADSVLRKLELDDDLREAVERARAVTSQVARRRAERALAGDLRRVDLRALETRLANVLATGAAEPQLFHLAERWRTRLIEGGLEAAAEFPGGAQDPLPQLIARAQGERATGKPPGAARALFRHITEVLKAQRGGPVADAADDADGGDTDGTEDDATGSETDEA